MREYLKEDEYQGVHHPDKSGARDDQPDTCALMCNLDDAVTRGCVTGGTQFNFGAESPSLSYWYSLSTIPSFLSSLVSVIA